MDPSRGKYHRPERSAQVAGSKLRPRQPEPPPFCPRYSRCSAGLCPVLGGVHAPGDAICLYLKEAVKPAARLRLTHLLREDVAEVVLRHGERLLHEQGALARKLREAAKRGSKVAQGAQLIHGLQSGRLHR